MSRLDRFVEGRGKYALIKMRDAIIGYEKPEGGSLLVAQEHVDFGDTPDTEFFVIRLKDKFAAPALLAYAEAAMDEDPEFARDVRELAVKASFHKNKKKPD